MGENVESVFFCQCPVCRGKLTVTVKGDCEEMKVSLKKRAGVK